MKNKEILKRPRGVGFFIIVSYNSQEGYYKLKSETERLFSPVAFESAQLPKWNPEQSEFPFTLLGEFTRIISFKRRIHREELPEMKKICVQIREKFAKQDSTLRIIPGYMSSHNIIIASSFDDFHRIYLFHGVYAEIIYKYERMKLQANETAPDFFKSKDVIYFYTNLREFYLSQIKD